MNYTIFDLMYPKYKIKKPIRLIELFAGYGSQLFALKYLNKDVEHWKICEWATKSIQAYNDAHIQDYTDYSKDLTDEEVLNLLVKYGVSINYNNPATMDQLKRQKFRTIYNNIVATNNLVNIQTARGKDFNIVDQENFDYLMTYSFPCQDLSQAGKGKGMSDTSTRSGMLWEVERILTELSLTRNLPQILLMENVPQVHGQDNIQDFNKWQLRLEELGYQNYFKDLIATDYGIPQIRNRCYMISILGDYSYSFPLPQKLELKLSDLLEKNVDNKYYLSEKMINCFNSDGTGKYPRGERFRDNIKNGTKDLANTIITTEGTKPTCNFIIETENYIQWHEKGKLDMECRAYKENKVSPTLHTKSGNIKLLMNDLKIRRLTPRECFRLMGVKDDDFKNIAKNQSNHSLYHLAGDSIVVNVLMAIFKELF